MWCVAAISQLHTYIYTDNLNVCIVFVYASNGSSLIIKKQKQL